MAKKTVVEPTGLMCPRCGQVTTDVVTVGKYTFHAACFWGWAGLAAERIVAEVPPVQVAAGPAPVAEDPAPDVTDVAVEG